MDPQERGGLGADRALVVRGAGPVRRADLDHARARAGEDVGDPEAVADLDQLAARHDDLASLGERCEGEQDRRGVVVHDERRLGTREPPKRLDDVGLPRAALAGLEVELEVRVRPADLHHPLERGSRERRPAEVRVDDHAGRVEDPPQRRRPEAVELGTRRGRDVARVAAGEDRRARTLERSARGGRRQRSRRFGQRLVGEQPVDRREVAQVHRSPVYEAAASRRAAE